MDFNHFLTSYLPDPSIGSKKHFNNLISQAKLAEELIGPFLECIVAPSYSKAALNVFKKKKNLRVISIPHKTLINKYDIKSALGGYLFQERDSLKKILMSMSFFIRN